MTCKVRRDFEIITDVSSRVSPVTSNARGSLIRSSKSLFKKKKVMRFCQSWRQLSKRFRRPRPVILQSATTDLLWQPCVKQPALTHTPSPPKGREEKDATKTNFSSCSDHSWIKTSAIFSNLTFEFECFFFCGLLSSQHKTLVLMVHVGGIYLITYYSHLPVEVIVKSSQDFVK